MPDPTRLPLPVEFYDPATGEVVAKLAMGSAEGASKPTLYMGGGDIVNARNVQGGFLPTGTANFDVSAGGDGEPGSGNDRGVFVVNRDNGRGFDVGRGRPARPAAMSQRAYDDPSKDVVTFNVPVHFAKGAWHKSSTGLWVRYT